MNLKQASFLTLAFIAIQVILTAINVLIMNLLNVKISPEYFQLTQMIQYPLTIIPIIFYALKKFDLNLRRQFNSFNARNFVLLLIVTILLFANILPFSQPIKFFKGGLEGKFLYFQLNGFQSEFWIIVNFINTVLLYPILEEIFFRGIILKGLLRNYKPLFSIVISSLVFAVYHLNPEGILYLIMYGLLFGFAFYLTKSLYVSIFLHMIINFLAFLTKTNYQVLNSSVVVVYLIFLFSSCLVIFLIIKNVGSKLPLRENKEIEQEE